jgi:hypothetical protein
MGLPFSNTAPARTRATRCGAFTARQRASAASISLNAIASPAAREPGTLVTLLLKPHLGTLDFVAAKDNVVFLGPPGVPKSHFAIIFPIEAPTALLDEL